MTPEEAIEIIWERHMDCEDYRFQFDDYPDGYDFEFDQAILMAAQALEEIQQYREIGTVEELKNVGIVLIKRNKTLERMIDECMEYEKIGTVEECWEAREKQIPKKPVCKPKPYNESVGFNEEWFCPSCGAYIGYFYEGMDEPEQMEYCNECGQHIARDWSDKFDDE